MYPFQYVDIQSYVVVNISLSMFLQLNDCFTGNTNSCPNRRFTAGLRQNPNDEVLLYASSGLYRFISRIKMGFYQEKHVSL